MSFISDLDVTFENKYFQEKIIIFALILMLSYHRPENLEIQSISYMNCCDASFMLHLVLYGKQHHEHSGVCVCVCVQ